MTHAAPAGIGSAEVWLLNDGDIPGRTQATGPAVATRIPVNGFLVRSAGRLILVDTGLGDKWLRDEPDLRRRDGSVLDAIARAGFDVDDVDVVVNTHLHVDHAGGNTVWDPAMRVRATFPKAQYVVQRRDWEFATSPPSAWAALFRPDDFEPLLGSDRLLLAQGPMEVTEEVRCLPAPGHTPGHQVVIIESGAASALLTGDAIVGPDDLRWPDRNSAGDVDAGLAAATRRGLVAWAASHGAWLGIAHTGTTLRKIGDILAASTRGVGP